MNDYKLGFLFLGAGSSSRMLGDDKLLKKIDDVPQIQRILNEALSLSFPVFVTTPANNNRRKDAIFKTNAAVIEVENSHLGMAKVILSLQCWKIRDGIILLLGIMD